MMAMTENNILNLFVLFYSYYFVRTPERTLYLDKNKYKKVYL